MIEITVFRNNGKITGFVVNGHAEYGREGEDIVCAAISALSLTGLFATEKLCELTQQLEQPSKGDLKLLLPQNLDKEQQCKAETVLETVVIGMYATAKNYPENVTIYDEGGEYTWK